MEEIKNIVFDFGGVLLDWNPRYFYRTFFSDENEMEYFLAHICNNEWNEEQDRGRSFADGIKILQDRYPEYAEAIRMYHEGWPQMLKGEIPEGVNLLKELKGEGYNIFGLTNWSSETIGIAYERYGFFKLFDGIVVSGEEKLIKPDRRIYEVLLDRYALAAAESVFLDDNIHNVEAARELGFEAIRFDGIEKVKQKLNLVLG